jgi:hypothetical protein
LFPFDISWLLLQYFLISPFVPSDLPFDVF